MFRCSSTEVLQLSSFQSEPGVGRSEVAIKKKYSGEILLNGQNIQIWRKRALRSTTFARQQGTKSNKCVGSVSGVCRECVGMGFSKILCSGAKSVRAK